MADEKKPRRPRRPLGAATTATPAAASRPPGGDGGGPDIERRLLPDNCPVKPLGYFGKFLYVQDDKGQLHKLDCDRIGRVRLQNLCATDYLKQHWGRYRQNPKTGEWVQTGWHPDYFLESIENSCKAVGIFDEAEMLRGRGCYRGEDGKLILHLGDHLLLHGRWHELGRIGAYVYPLAIPLPGPATSETDPGTAQRLLQRVTDGWRFKHGIDPLLILGMIGVIVLAGALPVRPGCFLTGERGTGKSELMFLLQAVLGRWLIYSTDATEAGIRQQLGRDAIGMMLDELESGEAGDIDNRKIKQICLYWRASYGGGRILRGGANHTGAQFSAQAALIAAAVNQPAFDAPDRSRIITIELTPLPVGVKTRLVHDAMWPDVGKRLIRRLIDQAERIAGEYLPAMRAILIDQGWDDRLADTYGTPLACAWAMLHDTVPTIDDLGPIWDDLAERHRAHKGDETPTWRLVFLRLWGWRADIYRRGEVRTLGEYVQEAGGWGRDDPSEAGWRELDLDGADRTERDAEAVASQDVDARKAQAVLRRHGIRIFHAPEDGPHWRAGERLIAIANASPALAEIFRDTPWGATASGHGGWHTALSRAPTAVRWPEPMRFPFGRTRAVVMRLDVALSGMVGPDPIGVAQAWDQAAAEPA